VAGIGNCSKAVTKLIEISNNKVIATCTVVGVGSVMLRNAMSCHSNRDGNSISDICI